jgi:hypothetical protein
VGRSRARLKLGHSPRKTPWILVAVGEALLLRIGGTRIAFQDRKISSGRRLVVRCD